jgi:hypothetical protein
VHQHASHRSATHGNSEKKQEKEENIPMTMIVIDDPEIPSLLFQQAQVIY